ncbi:MAG: hypothetical protein PHX51_03335 [Clostridia bacterium]|nr:hypothetical protein [Clostridia bacterium]
MDKELNTKMSIMIDKVALHMVYNINSHIHEIIAERGDEFTALTEKQRRFLSLLDYTSDGLLSELAIKAEVSYSNISGFLYPMEALGYVEKVHLPNSRNVVVRLLPKGKQVLDEFDRKSFLEAEKMFDLALTAQEQQRLYDILSEAFDLLEKVASEQKKIDDSGVIRVKK